MEGFPHVQGVSSLSQEGPCFMFFCILKERERCWCSHVTRRGLAVAETRVSTAPLASLRSVTRTVSAHPQTTSGREAGKVLNSLCQACDFKSFCGNIQGDGGGSGDTAGTGHQETWFLVLAGSPVPCVTLWTLVHSPVTWEDSTRHWECAPYKYETVGLIVW